MIACNMVHLSAISQQMHASTRAYVMSRESRLMHAQLDQCTHESSKDFSRSLCFMIAHDRKIRRVHAATNDCHSNIALKNLQMEVLIGAYNAGTTTLCARACACVRTQLD